MDSWPKKFLAAFRMLLSHDPARRPRMVDDLLLWLIDPPPPPVLGFLALHTDADTAKLLLDCTGVDMGLEMTIQCGRRSAPQQPSDGTTVAEGPLRPVVGIHYLPVTTDPIYYTIFTRQKKADYAIYSPGVSTELWQPTEANLSRWAEEQAAAAFDAQPMPTGVGMVLGALDVQAVTDSLCASFSPVVRGWGLHRVEQGMRVHGYSDSLERLLWRFLADPHAELRQAAANSLWASHPAKSDEVLIRLIEALDAPPIDAPIPLLRFLRQLQISEERSRAALEQLEARRPTECPLCKKPLTLGERGPHLHTEHGYLLYEGDLLPSEAVIGRLWERVLHHQDRAAHEELADMYLTLPAARKNPAAAVEHYLSDLTKYYLGETPPGDDTQTIPVALAYTSVVAFQNSLRFSKLFLPIARELLRSRKQSLCDLGFQAVLPYIQEQLATRASADDLRRVLNTLCSDPDQTDLQIDLCRHLAQLGVDPTLARACMTQLEEERLVVCEECRSEVQAKDIDLHMRRAHEIYQFRGLRLTYAETRTAILGAICTPPPDVAAWRSLQSLADDKHPQEADRYVVVWLYQHIRDVDPETRGSVVTAVVEAMAAAGAAIRLLPLVVAPGKNASWELLGQRIALEICARVTDPMPPELIRLVLPFLDQKELPRRSRENAVLAMLRLVRQGSPLGGRGAARLCGADQQEARRR